MTDREPIRRLQEFDPRNNPDLLFSEVASWTIADNTYRFAKSAEIDLENGGVKRTGYASFNHNDAHISMFFEGKGEDPRKILVQGVSVKGDRGPTPFNYVVTKDKITVKGSKAQISGEEESVLKALMGRANLLLTLPDSVSSDSLHLTQ